MFTSEEESFGEEEVERIMSGHGSRSNLRSGGDSRSGGNSSKNLVLPGKAGKKGLDSRNDSIPSSSGMNFGMGMPGSYNKSK